MENIITTPEKFNKVKTYLDGLVFWREVENGIEIKFIKCYLKWIDSKLINFLKTN